MIKTIPPQIKTFWWICFGGVIYIAVILTLSIVTNINREQIRNEAIAEYIKTCPPSSVTLQGFCCK